MLQCLTRRLSKGQREPPIKVSISGKSMIDFEDPSKPIIAFPKMLTPMWGSLCTLLRRLVKLFHVYSSEWILLNTEVNCANNDDNSPATLGLNNMRGVFILVGVGIVGGMLTIFLGLKNQISLF